MAASRYVVGIDLGTTNCAVGYAPIDGIGDGAHDGTESGTPIEMFAIEQVVAAGEIEARPTLPSFLLLPSEHEVKPEAMALPWRAAPAYTVGTMARERGAELPQRLVSSAKSWLSHTAVDRKADILPWLGSEKERAKAKKRDKGAQRVSPVTASARYLEHIRDAWDTAHPDAPLVQQELYLTVPASFDAVARELTVNAARSAGLSNVTLLEEPQAAFYSWLARSETQGPHGAAEASDWRTQIKPGDVVLVFDIGGGTTDFSLISASDDGTGNLALERIAVGDHILLGGDNVDLALAHGVMQGLGRKAKRLKPMQKRALVYACRRAKETLLSSDPPESVPISILGSGSRLIGGTIRTQVTGAQVRQLVDDGFFPTVAADDRPQVQRTIGLRELGLPYAHDPAITRHLAAFLTRHGRAPTAILYNGGVMKGNLLRTRIADIIGSWFGGEAPRVLTASGRYLDLAVAHGATYYGLVRRGRGIRIRGGTARSYYIGVESSMPAIPGFPPPIKCLCVAPFGMEEGSSVDLPDEELGLVVGETAEFRFFASSTLRDDSAGDVRDPDEDLIDPEDDEDDEGGLHELDPVEALLPAEGDVQAGELVPVSLRAKVTEVGTLELWCVARSGAGQWKLEYSVREDADAFFEEDLDDDGDGDGEDGDRDEALDEEN